PEPLPQDEPDDLPGPRAEGEANPDLGGALPHMEGEDAVDPERGEEEPDEPEGADHRRRQALREEREPELSRERTGAVERDVGVELPDHIPDPGQDLAGDGARGAGEQGHIRPERLGEGEIDVRPQLRPRTQVLRVSYDPDHLDLLFAM